MTYDFSLPKILMSDSKIFGKQCGEMVLLYRAYESEPRYTHFEKQFDMIC